MDGAESRVGPDGLLVELPDGGLPSLDRAPLGAYPLVETEPVEAEDGIPTQQVHVHQMHKTNSLAMGAWW